MRGVGRSLTTASETDRIGTMDEIFSSESSFVAFYEMALPRIYGYLLARCGGDPAVAEELTQQTFVGAVRERSRFEGRASAMTWLTAIARHKLADHYRRESREERRRLRIIGQELANDPEARAWDALDEHAAIVSALATLPALQRAVLVLRFADGLSMREVGRAVGKSESAVESLMKRARDGFKRAYGTMLDG